MFLYIVWDVVRLERAVLTLLGHRSLADPLATTDHERAHFVFVVERVALEARPVV